ncbi:MAG: AbrB/MazE/SpoVT family DNA-binding domain-containing protein [Thaumarchaeota archaeon]|nr:AbrB/MazE/SpoVT family DNA-binding domain-containing protein [Nitrososphaerota archaeon]
MDIEDIQRRVQFRQGSYMVTIPAQIAHALGIRKNQYVRFAVSNKKVVIKPVESGFTKKDITEAEKGSAALDRYDAPIPPSGEEEQNGYMEDLAEALERKPSGATTTQSRIEKLRMR